MTLDEAIQNCEERAKLNRAISEISFCNTFTKESCRSCAEEHEQLAEWLKELKAYKELFTSPEEAEKLLEQFMV